MNQYFRITAYLPAENLSIIVDSNGKYEKLWQFSSDLIQKGFKIIEVSSADKFLDGNMPKVQHEPDKIVLRATIAGTPEKITHSQDKIAYQAIKVGDKIYVSDIDKKAQ